MLNKKCVFRKGNILILSICPYILICLVFKIIEHSFNVSSGYYCNSSVTKQNMTPVLKPVFGVSILDYCRNMVASVKGDPLHM